MSTIYVVYFLSEDNWIEYAQTDSAYEANQYMNQLEVEGIEASIEIIED